MNGHHPLVAVTVRSADERVRAIADMGFTERQARFLVLVMRHAGVCIPRQYASFAGIANGGRKCNAFFARLVRRGLAARSPASTTARGCITYMRAASTRLSARARAGIVAPSPPAVRLSG